MTMKNELQMNRVFTFLAVFALLVSAAGCQEHYTEYSDAEYIMFSDTAAVYPVLKDADYFPVPVVSTVACSYDRTVGVEIIDKGSNAIEGLHYALKSNTVTIKAGERRADVYVRGIYENIEPEDSLGFTMRLVMDEALELPLYGTETKVVLMKCCPFDVNSFCGHAVVTSMFLYQYSLTGSYQRLIKTEPSEKENTIICRGLLYDGYDVELTFDPSDPLNPIVTLPDVQVLSDEGSVFGIAYGDDKILVTHSILYPSYFNTCQNYVALWIKAYVEDLGSPIGTVGNFYNVLEWVSEEEAERLHREEGL